jgi:hypothetical protein
MVFEAIVRKHNGSIKGEYGKIVSKHLAPSIGKKVKVKLKEVKE